MSIDHYENFPVASVLCPPALRPAVVAIYHFARTADDIADEGDAARETRLADLNAYEADLDALFTGGSVSPRWRNVFERLAIAVQSHGLARAPLADLLDAFKQDTANPVYAGRTDLLAYCQRSANPIGRMLLHLYGISDARSQRQSDAVCSALQLINFWQDCSVDLPRGRVYLPQSDAAQAGVDLTNPAGLKDSPATRALLAALCDWARHMMLEGAPLACRIPGRAGWELRLVVQGGLRLIERMERMNFSTIQQRPVLGPRDFGVIAWRSVGMRRDGRAAR